MEIAQIVDARTVRYPSASLPELLSGLLQVVAVRGSQATTFASDALQPQPRPDLIAQLLGPTGNLRAPTIRVGRRLIVGFQPSAYARLLKKKAGEP